jgi:choline kinase
MSGATAIVLAAGRGRRMGVATDERPKCLVTLAGRRLLDWQLGALREAGVDSAVLVGGYRADQLRALRCRVVESRRWDRANMVTSLMCARDALAAETCIVTYADIVFHPDAVRALMRARRPIAITYDRCWHALWRERFDDPLSDAESLQVDDTALREIGRRASRVEDVQGQYMGLLRFEPNGWNAVERALSALTQEEVDRLDMTTLLARLLATGIPVEAIPVEGRWCEVDRIEDVRLYEAAIARADAGGERWMHDWRWSEAR